MKPTPNEIRLERANRRIQRRDRKIAGLQREIKRLEQALAWRTIDLESVTRNVHDAVQRALCNVRMIPIHGWTRDQVIAEVRTVPTNQEQ
jgi:multidrug resistance efflux pump